MEKHFLEGMESGEPEFRPAPWYNPHGDCIVHQIADEAVIAERIDELLTLYRSAVDRRVIGYQVKGVQALIQRFGWDGLYVECAADTSGKEVRQVSVAALLLAAYEARPPTINRRSAYAQSFQDAAGACIPETELVTA